MDTGGPSASIGNEEVDLPKFVAFNSRLHKNYLRPEGMDGYIRFGAVDAISWGVKHEVQKAECGGGLVHIRCCDTGKYWSWGLTDYSKSWIVAALDQPGEDKTTRVCTLIRPSKYTKDGHSVLLKLEVMYEGTWRSICGKENGYLVTGDEELIISDWELLPPIVNEEMDLPKFIVFSSLSNKNYLCPGGVHKYMKFEAVNVVQWGVKHEVQKAKYGGVHIRCCDNGKYWSWGPTKDSVQFITAQADQPIEDTSTETCTLIKIMPSHKTKTKVDGDMVVRIEVMYEDKWWPVGGNKDGYLVVGDEDLIISNWESLQANQAQVLDTGGSSASIGDEEWNWPQFVVLNSFFNRNYLSPEGANGYIRFAAVDASSWGVKHKVEEAKSERGLVHIRCCDTGKYWSWGLTDYSENYIVVQVDQPGEDKFSRSCTLVRPSKYTKDGFNVVNFEIMWQGTWWSIGVNSEGFLVTGGEDFIVSDWDTQTRSSPSGVNVADFVSLKFGPTNYFAWKQQLLTFLASKTLGGFVDGTTKPPNKPSRALEEEIREEQEHGRKPRTDWDQNYKQQRGWKQVSKQEWEKTERTYAEWKRWDDLARGWILATLTEEVQRQVEHMATAQEVWVKLEEIFNSTFQLSHLEEIDWKDQQREHIVSEYAVMHKAALTADWNTAIEFLEGKPDAFWKPIASCLETALIVAVRSSNRNKFVDELIKRMVQKDVKLLERKDISGATALHAAVDGANLTAAKWLVEKNRELANIEDKRGTLPVHLAAGLGNRKMVDILLKPTTKLDEEESGLKLLHFLASSGLFDVALTFLEQFTNLASLEPSPLVVIAEKRSSFLSGSSLNILQRLIYSVIPLKFEVIANQPQEIVNHHEENDIESHAKCIVPAMTYGMQKLNALFWDVAGVVPLIKSIRETKLSHLQAINLVKCLCEEAMKTNLTNAQKIFTEALRNATCTGIHEIVEEILGLYPSAMHLRGEKDPSLFHLAVVNRQENVFNLIYQMEEDQHGFLSVPDASKNNALHSAGNLTSQQQLVLRASAAGAALQMQRELRWFKEVGNLILPQAKERKNKDGKTPQELFTETHKDLVEQGEKWMKDTANSCSIVAALITTIVFAAAITVPGGSNGDSGLPIGLGHPVFTLFLVSDALAMFFSSTSLLMFLSILTSRYGEQDFLYSLPRRMIIGLATLFLSIMSMMIAFGATLKIVSGKTRAWIIICVAILSCVPVTLFVLLQFPLLLDMIKSTYYPSIRKQSNRILH